MKKNLLVIVLITGLGLFASCGNEASSEQDAAMTGEKTATAGNDSDTASAPDGHTSKDALDIAGRYIGFLPCADCPGQNVEIELNENGTFIYFRSYEGKEDAPQNMYDGKYTWVDGNTIELKGEGMENIPGKFRVGENKLTQLDMDGKVIEGKLAERYILKKSTNK